jgi:hypothetical protein
MFPRQRGLCRRCGDVPHLRLAHLNLSVIAVHEEQPRERLVIAWLRLSDSGSERGRKRP